MANTKTNQFYKDGVSDLPKLNCSVETCKYQKGGLCAASAINVDNSDITINETMCSTYICTEFAIDKTSHHTCEDIGVHCTVTDCVHNNNELCNARKIQIGGFKSTVICDGTECESFMLK